MAANLNYNSGTGNSACYDDNPANCVTYGRLYDWSTAMTVCPSGWHLPSDAEWGALMQFVNPSCSATEDCANAGTKLKATSGWNGSGNGTDEYGFSALPGGYGRSPFGAAGKNGYWWSSTDGGYDNLIAYYRVMVYDYEIAYRDDYCGKNCLFSVRCVKNAP